MTWRDATETLLKPLITSERVGLITDMDGTLAPIVPNPDDAYPTERSKKLLAQLSEHLTLVAAVSGRAVADLHERVNLPGLVYSGNHGLERWENDKVVVAPMVLEYENALQKAKAAVTDIAPEGVMIEDKGATLSVHYRNAAIPAEINLLFEPKLRDIADKHNLRLFSGRKVFELRPPLDIDKGTVFKQLIEENNLDAAIYIGDDTTDADALKMARQLRDDKQCHAVGMGVQSDDTPSVVLISADCLADGVEGVEDFLEWFLKSVMASVI
ncbi:MAG: trehalose-phosphatase [Anaerolineaceae bacterium]|nr:trehalose-phosphatase [Anaerolineaceae bacterium]